MANVINISAPFIFKGKTPVSRSKFDAFQKANPHMALMNKSGEYGAYFSKLFGLPIKVVGTSSKNVMGKRFNTEHWWTKSGVLALMLEGPKGWKKPTIGTIIPDAQLDPFTLNRFGSIPAWVVSANFPAEVSTIRQYFP